MQHPYPADLFLLYLKIQAEEKARVEMRSPLLFYIHGFLRHVKQIETVCGAPRLYSSWRRRANICAAAHTSSEEEEGAHTGMRLGVVTGGEVLIWNPSAARRMDSCWLEAWRARRCQSGEMSLSPPFLGPVGPTGEDQRHSPLKVEHIAPKHRVRALRERCISTPHRRIITQTNSFLCYAYLRSRLLRLSWNLLLFCDIWLFSFSWKIWLAVETWWNNSISSTRWGACGHANTRLFSHSGICRHSKPCSKKT